VVVELPREVPSRRLVVDDGAEPQGVCRSGAGSTHTLRLGVLRWPDGRETCGWRTDDWLVLKLHEEVGELTQAFLNLSGRSRDRGLSDDELRDAFRGEVADALAQLLLVARRFDVDLPDQLERKWFR
jgi:NTP pyrophosphatase (non-canonical NTP hydrolase)